MQAMCTAHETDLMKNQFETRFSRIVPHYGGQVISNISNIHLYTQR